MLPRAEAAHGNDVGWSPAASCNKSFAREQSDAWDLGRLHEDAPRSLVVGVALCRPTWFAASSVRGTGGANATASFETARQQARCFVKAIHTLRWGLVRLR